jgi:hypothetical protein
MKKRNLKSLRLNKKSISNVTPNQLTGGDGIYGSLAQCSEVMSCITYTQNNQSCQSCVSIHICVSREIPCN